MLNNNVNNLITSLNLQQTLEDRKVFEQFAKKPDHVTKDAAKGRLVKENPIQQFGSMITDNVRDVRNLGAAFTSGKSNDHSLGRMNDLGMKLGGGIIAAALMGARSTSNKKLMEVLGFTTFFSAMSLWPKLAIDLPTKIRYGFNPHQKYVDSQGRKKQFFQDNQYLPWDVWSKEDINKVADKMGVPKDLKDREEFTKEKMRTIALQDNTLWMLTAGFASPLLTSLACNRIDNALKVPVAKMELKSIGKNIENSDEYIKDIIHNKGLFSKQDETFSSLMASLKEGNMPKNLEEQLNEIFDIRNAVKGSEFKNQIADKKLGSSIFKEFFGNIKPTLVFEDSDLLKYLTKGETPEKANEILSALNKAKAEIGEGATLKQVVAKLEESNNPMSILTGTSGAGESWIQKLSKLSKENPEKAKEYALKLTKYDKEVLKRQATEIETIYSGWLKPSQAQMRFFEENLGRLNNISGEKYNRAGKAFLKTLGFSDKEITAIKKSDEASGNIQKIITEKLSGIASDETQYKKAMENLDKEIAKIEGSDKKGILGKIDSCFNKLVEKVKSGITKAPNNATSKMKNSLQDTLTEGLSQAEIETAKTSMTSVNSSLIKLRSALEMEKAIQDGTIFTKWAKATGIDAASMTKEDKDLLAALFRRLGWQSSYGDVMNKGYTTGNGDFFKKLVNTIFSGAEEGSDKTNWQRKVHELFVRESYIPNPTLSKEGDEILRNFTQSAWNAMDEYNKANPGSPISNFGQLPKETLLRLQEEAAGEKASEIFKSSSIKFADLGESTVAMVKKQASQVYNDRKWMKVFGGLTVALVGITLISQLFFGKVKDAHLYKKQENKDTFESGK